MSNTSRILVSLVFFAIAIFLVIYTWLPARDSLQSGDGKVTHLIAQPNSWYEVEITTANSIRITCRARRGWPLLGPSCCPLEQFERLLGQDLFVMHDGRRPYQVKAGNEMVLDYSAHRKVQITAIVLAGLMLLMAALVWRHR